jgi:chromate transporter
VEVAAAFLKLGLTSVGGPVAHLSYFRAEFVLKRGWLKEEQFADLLALCQFLPGPASSQLAYALGQHRAGPAGAMAASLCFTLPSALAMTMFAYGMASAGDINDAGWLHGLKLAAVPVVAQAVWGMGRRLCPDWARRSVCLVAAAALLVAPGALAQVVVIATAGVVGMLMHGRTSKQVEALEPLRSHVFSIGALMAFVVLLVLLPVLAAGVSSHAVAVFDGFYRAGALVFGGGHVVLPLLRAETVPTGWVTDDQFLAGYGAAQAVPGPLFSFAAYLGTSMTSGPHAWLMGMWCLLAVFLPGWLLIAGALPFWHRVRSTAWGQTALAGANAAVVGVLLAALYSPVVTEAVHGPIDVGVALVAYGMLETGRAPAWLVVFAMALVGHVWRA